MDNTTPKGDGQPLHSWQIVRHILNNSDMTIHQTMILMYLADHANRDKGWKVWPSVETIAHHCRVTTSTVTRATNELCVAGYLIKERIKGIPPRNEYYLNVEAIFSMKSTNMAQTQVYNYQGRRFKHGTDAGLNMAMEVRNRVLGSGYPEQATEEHASTSMCMYTPDGVTRVRMTASKGPALSKSQAQEIIRRIPVPLLTNLSLITDDHKGFGAGHYAKQLETHIRFRGALDWTQICWYVLNRLLLGQSDPEWREIRDPATYTASVADRPEYMAELCPYSDKALYEAIAAHNGRVDDGES